MDTKKLSVALVSHAAMVEATLAVLSELVNATPLNQHAKATVAKAVGTINAGLEGLSALASEVAEYENASAAAFGGETLDNAREADVQDGAAGNGAQPGTAQAAAAPGGPGGPLPASTAPGTDGAGVPPASLGTAGNGGATGGQQNA